jgi:hypothetical protein
MRCFYAIIILLLLVVDGRAQNTMQKKGVPQKKNANRKPVPAWSSHKRDDLEEADNFIVCFGPPAARFPGTDGAWCRFLQKQLQCDSFPEDAPNGCQTVMLQFIVERDGRLSNISVLDADTLFGWYVQQALRVIRKSPRWVPAQQGGSPVKSYHRQAIQFCTEPEVENGLPLKQKRIDTLLKKMPVVADSCTMIDAGNAITQYQLFFLRLNCWNPSLSRTGLLNWLAVLNTTYTPTLYRSRRNLKFFSSPANAST